MKKCSFGGYPTGFYFRVVPRGSKMGGFTSTPIYRANKEEAEETLALTYPKDKFILVFVDTTN
jgi:hypothetical protein